jgi:hypothetical protein
MEEKFPEAREWAQLARANAAEPDVHAQAMWRGVSAKLEAQAGRFDDADAMSQQAVELLESTDALNERGAIHLDRAEVLRLRGEERAARDTARLARDLFSHKGNIVAAARAEEALRQRAAV